MDLGLRQELEQQQTLHLTIELRQGLSVLQMSASDLVEYVEQCVEENPLLAIGDSQSSLNSIGPDERSDSAKAGLDAVAYGSTADAARLFLPGEEHRFSRLSVDALTERRGHGSADSFGKERRDMSKRSFSLDWYLTKGESLTEHLMAQLRMSTDDARVVSIGECIIGNLNASGYLTATVAEISSMLMIDESDILTVLEQVQRLDPPGVAARNLAECIRLQIDAKDLMTDVLDELLKYHLSSLERKSVASVACDMGISTDELEEALEVVRACDPKPGLQFGDTPEPVWPEVVVEQSVDGAYNVRMSDLHLPELKIDNQYRTMCESVQDKAASEYLKKKLEEAEGLIDGIQYRNATLYKVACCIVELQTEFLDEGFNRLRPLTMQQVADCVGVSQSTVSRLVNGNYIQTPRGTFELRFFFQSAALSNSDVEISAESVKRMIRELVDEEDPEHPLSDNAIAKMLSSEGVDISRRTVAKYRKNLNIPVCAARKHK